MASQTPGLAQSELLTDVPDETCWLCGGPTHGRGASVEMAIPDTFTDHDRARAPQSGSICEACLFCLKNKPLRTHSIFATPDALRMPKRSEWRDILLNPPGGLWLATIAVSGQKHLSFKAPVNAGPNGTVLLEETPVPIIGLGGLIGPVEELRQRFTSDEILTGRYSQNRIRQFGLARWYALEQVVSKHRRSRLLELAVYIANREEEKECTTDSTATMSTPQPQPSLSMQSTEAETVNGSRSRQRCGGRLSGPSRAQQSAQLTFLASSNP